MAGRLKQAKNIPTKTKREPKFGEEGYEFIVTAKVVIAEVDTSEEETRYHVTTDSECERSTYTFMEEWLTTEELKDLVFRNNPDLKQAVILDQIKETEELLAKLKKELTAL